MNMCCVSGLQGVQLLRCFTENGILKTDRVVDAMLQVDRGHFSSTSPYADSPQTIGYRATISAPHMVCMIDVNRYSMNDLQSMLCSEVSPECGSGTNCKQQGMLMSVPKFIILEIKGALYNIDQVFFEKLRCGNVGHLVGSYISHQICNMFCSQTM